MDGTKYLISFMLNVKIAPPPRDSTHYGYFLKIENKGRGQDISLGKAPKKLYYSQTENK